jgi:acyl-CoA thioesterase FadM
MVKYKHDIRVVFSHLTPEGNVSHAQYPKIFGDVRELFAIDFIQSFTKDVGKKYLLKTRRASYEYKEDFCLGDTIQVQMYVSKVNGASFELCADFVCTSTEKVRAIGKQLIVFADMNGMPRRLPAEWKELLNSISELNPESSGNNLT